MWLQILWASSVVQVVSQYNDDAVELKVFSSTAFETIKKKVNNNPGIFFKRIPGVKDASILGNLSNFKKKVKERDITNRGEQALFLQFFNQFIPDATFKLNVEDTMCTSRFYCTDRINFKLEGPIEYYEDVFPLEKMTNFTDSFGFEIGFYKATQKKNEGTLVWVKLHIKSRKYMDVLKRKLKTHIPLEDELKSMFLFAMEQGIRAYLD